MPKETIFYSSGNTNFLDTSSDANVDTTANRNSVKKTLLVSVLDHENLNGVLIAKKEGLEYYKTLINKPVQAYLKYDEEGRPSNFGGHELKRKLDADGEPMYYFDTASIGTHTNVWVENRYIPEYGYVDCILAEVELWTSRYPEYYAVAEKLIADGKLSSSWEIDTLKYEYARGQKQLMEFEFIGNTFLGSDVDPAVSGAGVLTSEIDNILTKALEKDLLVASMQEEVKRGSNGLENEKTIVSEEVVVVEPVVEEVVVEPTVEPEVVVEEVVIPENEVVVEDTVIVSSLTQNDIEAKIHELLTDDLLAESGLDREVFWIRWAQRIYPAESRIIMGYYGNNTTEDTAFLEIIYAVNGDEVSIVSVKKAEMQFIAVAEITEKENKITELSETLVVLNSKLIVKESEIAELSEARAKLDEIEKAEALVVKTREVAEFKEKYLATKMISESEFTDNEDIKKAVEELDDKAMKLIIAEKIMQGVKPDVAEVVKQTKAIDVKGDISAYIGFSGKPKGDSMSDFLYSNN